MSCVANPQWRASSFDNLTKSDVSCVLIFLWGYSMALFLLSVPPPSMLPLLSLAFSLSLCAPVFLRLHHRFLVPYSLILPYLGSVSTGGSRQTEVPYQRIAAF